MRATDQGDGEDQSCPRQGKDLAERLPVVVALLLLILLGAWLANPDLAYTTLGRDGWLYHAYFLDLRGHLQAFRDCYYSTRLSMTLPGSVVYSCVPGVAANHVLHLLVYLAGTLGLYATLRQTISARAGLLAALLLGGQFYFQLAASSDYCDGYAMAYFLLATAAAARAARSPRWRGWVFLSGAAALALVVTNVSYVLLLAPLGLFLLVLNQTGPRHSLEAAGFWLGLGAATLATGLAAVSHVMGGPLDFLAPSLSFAQVFSSIGRTPYKSESIRWVSQAGWLLMPEAAAVGAVVHLVVAWVRGDATRKPVVTCYQSLLLGMVVGLACLECTSRGIFLQYFFYATTFLLPLSVLAIAAQWGEWIDGLPARTYHGLVGAAVILPIVATVVRVPAGWLPWFPAVVMAAAVAVLVPRLRPGWSAVVVLLLLVGSDLVVRTCRYTTYLDRLNAQRSEQISGTAWYQCIDATMRRVRKFDRGYQALYWYDIEEPLGPLFDSSAGMGLWRPERTVGLAFPKVDPTANQLVPSRRIIVLSSKGQAVARVQGALEQYGLKGRVLTEWQTTVGSLHYRGYLLETESRSARTTVSQGPSAGEGNARDEIKGER